MILTKEKLKSIDIDIDLLINQKLAGANIKAVLFIVPTNRKSRHLKKQLISLAPNSSASKINIETLSTLSSKLLSLTKPFHQLSEAAAMVFIKQITKQCQFKYLSKYRDEIPPGTIDRIVNLISEYKRNGIKPESLIKESEKFEPTEMNKAHDIAQIYNKFLDKCSKLNAFEIGDVYNELNLLDENIFKQNAKTIFPEIELIYVDGFSEFTKPEISIISKLADSAKLFISFDYHSDNYQLFAHIEKCFNLLTEAGFNTIQDNREEESKFQLLLKENLFQNSAGNQADHSGWISKIVGRSREEEVELIGKKIKQVLNDTKVQPHEICVSFNLVSEYSTYVKDIFDKLKIPYNLTDRTPLQNSGPITAIINFLEIAENDYYYKNIFRAINSGFLNLDEVSVSNLLKVASDLKIVSGKENWKLRIKDELNSLLKQKSEYENAGQIFILKKALQDIITIEKLLRKFEKPLTLSEFKWKIQEFILESKLHLKLLSIPGDTETYVRSVTEFLSTINELLDLQIEEFGIEKKFPLVFFMEQIRTACSWARYNVKEKSNYGVLVTSIEEIRGLNFDYLFIGGLCDGLFPTKYNPEIFSAGTFRKKSFEHLNQERFMFYKTVCSSRKKMFLSYHVSNNGRETIPSSFIRDLDKLIVTKNISIDEFTDGIFSDEELQKGYVNSNLDEIDNQLSQSVKNNIKNSIEIGVNKKKDYFGGSSFNGDILAKDDLTISNEEAEMIEKKLSSFVHNQYSISQLEIFAKCPFKFFAERILGIETFEDPSEDVEAVEMGRFLHSILFEFYSTLRNERIVLQQCSENDFVKAKKLIFEIADRQLHDLVIESPLNFYEREKILGLDGNEKESILYRFLENERIAEKDFIPNFFEVEFGRLRNDESDAELNSSESINIGGFSLRGKIDRIEINDDNSMFNIVDYKLSGVKPSFNDLKDGVSLQLPLYLHAAAELLLRKFNRKFSPNEMFIYSLKYSADDFGKKKISLGSKKETKFNSIDELIANTIELIKKQIESISMGKFTLSKLEDRENKVCRFCQFRLICRIDGMPG